MHTALIIDDNAAVCQAVALLLRVHGIESAGALTPQAALNRVAEGDIALVKGKEG